MKAPFAAACILVALVSTHWIHASEPAPKDQDTPRLVAIEDPDLVFKKAFWRRPSADDRILHAERREWLDTDGKLLRWQWFLVVEPGPETEAWLDSNPFLLAPTGSARAEPGPSEAPEWVPASLSGYTLRQSPHSPHLQAVSPDRRRLYATDWGAGFE